MPRLELRISEELLGAARREAQRQGVPLSAWVREAIAFYVAWHEAQRADGPPEGSSADEDGAATGSG